MQIETPVRYHLASIRMAIIKNTRGSSLVVQWLRLGAPNARGPGLIPGQGTRYSMLQVRAHMLQLKDPTCHNEDLTRGNEDPVCCN